MEKLIRLIEFSNKFETEKEELSKELDKYPELESQLNGKSDTYIYLLKIMELEEEIAKLKTVY